MAAQPLSHIPSATGGSQRKAVVFKVNGLGDNVVFLPAFQHLRTVLPELEITLFTTPAAAQLYAGPLAPHAVIATPKDAFNKAYRKPWMLASWIWRARRIGPEACLLSYDQGSVAHMVASLSGAAVRTGGNTGHLRVSTALSGDVPLPADGCVATWNWRMTAAFSRSLGDTTEWGERAPPPDLGHLIGGAVRPKGARPRIVVHAGAAKPLNQWSVENFAAVAASLARDHEVIWISHAGTTGEAPAGTADAPVSTLGDFARWLPGADLFLGNNSGPMHVASAVGCPGVVVTGPSAFGWDPYWHRERWTILRHPNLYCAPCEVPDREPPGCINLQSPMACMRYWSRGMVEDACRARLATSRSLRP